MRIPVLTSALLVTVLLVASCDSEKPASAPAAKAPDEAAAMSALKEINRAQADFIRRTRRYAQNFDELIADHLLSAEPTADSTGYKFQMRPSPDAVSYTISATPAAPDAVQARRFFTDQTGVLRAETGKPATATSPEL